MQTIVQVVDYIQKINDTLFKKKDDVNNFIWLCELNCYLRFNKSITGNTFRKVNQCNVSLDKPFNRTAPQTLLSIDELKVIYEVLEYCKGRLSWERPVFDLQKTSVWRLIEDNEIIPNSLCFASEVAQIDEHHLAWATKAL